MKLSDVHSEQDIEMFAEVGALSTDEFISIYEGIENEINTLPDSNIETINQLENNLKDLLYWRCATDIELFSITYFSHFCKYPFNRFHLDTFEDYKLGERGIKRADSAPRGFAKSTIKALIKAAHDTCYKLEKFTIIISNTKPQAVQKLKDLSSEFVDNEKLVAAYGPFFNSKNVGAEDFICSVGSGNDRYEMRYLAVGSGTEIRGVRFREARPTKLICDDVEHSDRVEVEVQREKMENWYKDVISKIGNEETNIDFIGTVLHRQSLLKFLLINPAYRSREYRAIISWPENSNLWKEWESIYTNLDNTDRIRDSNAFYSRHELELNKGCEVLWPEKEPILYLMKEIIETGLRSFMKEKQNDPLANEEKPFNIESVKWCQLREDGIFVEQSQKIIPFSRLECLGTIDPSAGQTKPSANRKADYCSILTGYWDSLSSRLFVVHDFTKRVAPSAQIAEIFKINDSHKFHKFGIETNLFRGLLSKDIRAEHERRLKVDKKHLNIKIEDIYQTENKEKRIYTIEPKIFHGNIVLGRGLSPVFLNMMWDFPFGSHDDGPDALEMLWSLANGKYKLGLVNKQARSR